MGVGPLPGPSFGFGLAAGILRERWSLLAESAMWLKQELNAVDQLDAGGEVHRVEAALRSCRGFRFGRLEVAPCLRVAWQTLWARGTGVQVAARTATASWVAVGAGAQARYQFSDWFRGFAGLDAHFETGRPRLSIDGVGELAKLGPMAFTITLGSEWIF